MAYEIKTPVTASKARTLTHIHDAAGRLVCSTNHEMAEAIVKAINK